MSIVYTLPPKSSRLFTASGIVGASISNGKFLIDGKFPLLDAKPGFVYLLSAVSFSASMEQNVYVGSIVDTSDIPKISIVNESGVFVAGQPRQMVSFCSESPMDQWYSSDTGGKLSCRLSGTISQSAELISLSQISFAVTISIYEISANSLSGAFRDGIAPGAQNVFRGHL